MMPGSGEDALQTTGGQVDSIVLALIDAVYDKQDNVCQAICNSLCTLGKQQPNLVLSSCLSYLLRHPKLPLAHRILILRVMEQVCQDSLDKISKGLVLDLIKQAVEEMINVKEVVPEWQGAASGIVVSLGQLYHNEVMEFLLARFQPGSALPHFFIIQTLANLSTANVFGIVPYLKGILGQMLPMLGMAKSENMKWIFAYALSQFSESILEYLANIEKAPDPTVKKSTFSDEISTAYDVLFNSWLQSREAKVRAEVVKALGHMTHLLERNKLEEQLPKVIPGIISLYKRQQESYHTTQGLCMVLDAAMKNTSNSLEFQLDTILASLFPQVCIVPDYSQPVGVKNHNEVLRCFTVLASSYYDRLVNFLLQKLENNNERIRIGALTVLKHLINSCDPHLLGKMSILTGLKSILSDPSNKVKKVIAQVVVAMAHHGYLELEGGKSMIWFIARQCALPDELSGRRPADLDYVSNEALRAMCENVIHLLTTTVEKMENILWPDLLECLLPEEFTTAVAPISKSLSYLAVKKRELGADFGIDYSHQTNIPKPYVLLARMVVLLGYPFSGRNRGLPLLQLMKAIVPLIDKSLVALWDSYLPQMIQELEEEGNIWNQQKWEEQLADFLLKSIEEVDREDWTTKLGKSLLSQLSLYSSQPDDKIISIKMLGVVMKKVGNRQFINNALDGIFEGVQHSVQREREGCAVAVGYCGGTHLDAVIVKLEQVARGERKSSGLLGFIKDFKGDTEQEKIKATVILSYGYVALNALPTLLTTRIETPILRNVVQFYQSSKDACVKQSMLQSIKLIAEAVHPERLKEPFSFHSRDEVLLLMKNTLKCEMALPLTNLVRAQALGAASSLVSLDPPLSDQEKLSLTQVALNAVYPLPRDHNLYKNRDTNIEEYVEYDHLFNATFESLNEFLRQLLLKERTPENLQMLVKSLYPWMISKHDFERERCMQSVYHILNSYNEISEDMSFKPFSTLGVCLGLLIPRCTDPQVSIRVLALDCISALIQISGGRCNGGMSDNQNEISYENLKQQVLSDGPSSLFSLTNELAKIVSYQLPSDQVCSFIYSILEGLCDPHSNSSSGASVILNGVVKLRGHEIRPKVPLILEALQTKLGDITCPQTRTGALRSIRTLASHHLSAVIGAFLNSSFPFDDHIVDSWKILAQDQELGRNVIDYLLEILTDSTLFEIQPDPQNHKQNVQVASLQPLVAVCALREIFKVPEMESCVKDYFDKIFSLLLLVAGSYIDTYLPITAEDSNKKDTSFSFGKLFSDGKGIKLSPIRYVTESFKAFMICSKQEQIVSHLTEGGYWVVMQDENKYPEAIAALANALCKYCPHHIPKIVASLNSALNSPYETQRIVTVALFAEFLSEEYQEKSTLTEPLMNNLLGRLVDTSHIVRRLCIRGLACVSKLEKNQPSSEDEWIGVQRYSTTVLSAMMAGMDDKDDPDSDITLEAMSGLSSVLAQVAEQDVRGILVNIALRIRPMFDKEKPPVRAAAFVLFGNLSRFGDGPSKEPFVEQIHNNFVTLLLHLNDEDRKVIKSCKQALRLLGPMLGSESINNMFQKYLRDDGLLHYGEFINDLTKAVITDFPEKVNFFVTSCLSYLKSPSSVIQGNAAILLGFLLGNLPVEQHGTISKERICGALILLLKDPSPEVRIRAADALSLLSSY